MKRFLFTFIAMLFMATTASADAPKHRHNPQTVSAGQMADTAEIVAYSDTTGSVAAAASGIGTDDGGYAGRNGTGVVNEDVGDPLSFLSYLMTVGLGGTVVAVVCIVVLLLFLTSPLILIGFIFYFAAKRRKQRYRIVEKAIESGREIPQSLLNERPADNVPMWNKGIKNIGLGLGLVAFFYFIGANALIGIGWLVFFYGAGQAVIAKTTKGDDAGDESCDRAGNDRNGSQESAGKL